MNQTAKRTPLLRFKPPLVFAAWQRTFVWSLTAALLLFTAAKIVETLSQQTYNWDIDHEMYYGWQLTKGHLIWTIEYNDKLPVVQYLFALPGLYGSVKLWQIFSLVMIALAMTSFFFLLERGSSRLHESSLWPVTLTAFSASFFGFWCVHLPGTFSTINSSATSLFVIAVVSYIRWSETSGRNKSQSKALLALATLAASLSVSIRPYLLVALVPIQIGVLLPKAPTNWLFHFRRSTVSGFLRVFGWFAIAVFGLNALPYIVFGEFEAFKNGILFLASDRNPMNGGASMLHSITGATALFWVLYIFLCIVGGFVARQSDTRQSVLLASTFGALLLPFVFVYLHWWDHYIVLLVGPITLVMVLTFLGLSDFSMSKSNSQPGHRDQRLLPSLALVATAFLCSLGMITVYPDSVAAENSQHPEAESTAEFDGWLRQSGLGKPSFLFPESVYTHWRLKQDRHGFPHAANTDHILTGWWSDAPYSSTFVTPRNTGEYCQLLVSHGPQLVVLSRESKLTLCLSDSSETYQLRVTLQDELEPLNIYARRNPSPS